MLTNDSVYLSMLIGSQRKDIPYPTTTLTHKCRPWSKAALALPDFDYPAAVSVMVRGVNILDNRYDEGSFRSRALTALQCSRIRKAEKKLREFGLQMPSVASLVEEQHRREAVVDGDLDYYSQITEEMYSSVFSQTAILADAPTNFTYLADLGNHLGRVAYLLDSFVDFQEDGRSGSFNLYDHLGLDRKNTLMQYLTQSLSSIRERVAKVKLYRFEDTVRYVVTDGLQAKVQNILSDARFVARPIMYSVAPVVFMAILRNVLTSPSSGDDCCDCCDSGDCDGGSGTQYTTTTTQVMIDPHITDHIAEGATGGLIGGGGGILINEIASRMGGSAAPPTETPPEEPLSAAEESELDREAEEELGPDTDESIPPTETPETPPPEEPPEPPLKGETPKAPPERPVSRQDWLRDRETGKRPDTKLPPEVPKVDIQPPEDPEDGVKIAGGLDLPADPNVAVRELWKNIQDGWRNISEAPGKALDALKETEDGTEPQAPKDESEQEKGPEISPEGRKVLDGMKDSFRLPKRMTDEQRATRDAAEAEAGKRLKEQKDDLLKVPTDSAESLREFAEKVRATGRVPVTRESIPRIMKQVQRSETAAAAATGLDAAGSILKGAHAGAEYLYKAPHLGGGTGRAAAHAVTEGTKAQIESTFGSPQENPAFRAVAEPHEDYMKAMDILREKLQQNPDPDNLDHQDEYWKILRQIKEGKGEYDAVVP
jgi:hypothetical protein